MERKRLVCWAIIVGQVLVDICILLCVLLGSRSNESSCDVGNNATFYYKNRFKVEITSPMQQVGLPQPYGASLNCRSHEKYPEEVLLQRYKPWTNGIVPYSVGIGFAHKLYEFSKAIHHISSRTCLQFKKREDEADYILLDMADEWSSPIGNMGGVQVLEVGREGRFNFTSYLHGLSHVAGLVHEELRQDRDEYVDIVWENIQKERDVNFMKFTKLQIPYANTAYDYNSLMHSGMTAHANSEPTILAKRESATVGSNCLSYLDIQRINQMYCPGTIAVAIASEYDSKVVDCHWNKAIHGQNAISFQWNHRNNQKWRVDWNAFVQEEKGSQLVTWAQGTEEVMVLQEIDLNATMERMRTRRILNRVHVAITNSSSVEQLWTGQRVGAESEKESTDFPKYQIRNKASRRCLSNPSPYVTAVYANLDSAPCNATDVRQVWSIYRVVDGGCSSENNF